MFRTLALVFGLTLAWGCSSETAGGDPNACAQNEDCEAGFACIGNTCTKLCRIDNDCGANNCSGGTICSSGTCIPGCRDSVPEITAVNGDGTSDPGPADPRGQRTMNHLQTAIVIDGQNLEGAAVGLVDGSSNVTDLTIASSTANQITAEVPAIAAGQYTLTVANSVGSDQATVWVLQGETGPTGPAGMTPTAMDIQQALMGFPVDAVTLGGQPVDNFLSGQSWGRFLEAEAMTTGPVGTIDTTPGPGASGGAAVQATFGGGNGTVVSVTSADLGELIATTHSEVEMRFKVLTNMDAMQVGQLICEATPFGGAMPVQLSTPIILDSSHPADAWSRANANCPFLPDDLDQEIRVEFTAGVTDIWVDSVRVTPVPGRLWAQEAGDRLLTLRDELTGNELIVGTDGQLQSFLRVRPLGGTGIAFTGNNDTVSAFMGTNSRVGIGTAAPATAFHSAGQVMFNTASNTQPAIFSRNNSIANENFSVGVTDGVAELHYLNDEAANVVRFRMENTDTESGGGAAANDNTVLQIRGGTNGGSVGIRMDPGNSTLALRVSGAAEATAWNIASSRARKTDIRALDAAAYQTVLEQLDETDVVRYRYLSDGSKHLGIIAEDAPPDVLAEGGESVSIADFTAFVMAATKAQQDLIRQQNERIERLERELREIKAAGD